MIYSIETQDNTSIDLKYSNNNNKSNKQIEIPYGPGWIQVILACNPDRGLFSFVVTSSSNIACNKVKA